VTVARALLPNHCIFVGLFLRSIDESSWLAPLRTRTNSRGCHASVSLCACVSVSVCLSLFVLVCVCWKVSFEKEPYLCRALFAE